MDSWWQAYLSLPPQKALAENSGGNNRSKEVDQSVFNVTDSFREKCVSIKQFSMSKLLNFFFKFFPGRGCCKDLFGSWEILVFLLCLILYWCLSKYTKSKQQIDLIYLNLIHSPMIPSPVTTGDFVPSALHIIIISRLFLIHLLLDDSCMLLKEVLVWCLNQKRLPFEGRAALLSPVSSEIKNWFKLLFPLHNIAWWKQRRWYANLKSQFRSHNFWYSVC